MDEIHKSVGYKPVQIGSHTVDGESNAGESIYNLEWETIDVWSQKIVSNTCDSHKWNTSAVQYSRTTWKW